VVSKWPTEIESMTKTEVRSRIEQIGIIPGIRVSAGERARYAAEAVYRAGLPITEVTMTVPGAIDVISHLTRAMPDMVVGAGTVLDAETARRCLDAGARFLTSTGLVMEVVELALKQDMVVFPGAFTATEVIAAWKSGADYVKVFPWAPVGGPNYIRALKVPFPQVPLIATGGVNQQTAGAFIQAGATALGIGGELIPSEALYERQEEQIQELARRFLTMVKDARNHKAGIT
jgi:2-dehydro-3-deoxyphosphogluconate aldolase / (4S)-4-hydroxy-2-oxoglutarate aldolase